jgi:hypothetical protein
MLVGSCQFTYLEFHDPVSGFQILGCFLGGTVYSVESLDIVVLLCMEDH